MPKNFTQTHHFILAKLLKFQETFLEKFLVSGFGADSPNIQYTRKNAVHTAFFNYRQNKLELRSKPCFKELFVKSSLKIRKNFASNTPLYFGKSFLVSKGLFTKSPLGQGLGQMPQLIMPTQKSTAMPCFLFSITLL